MDPNYAISYSPGSLTVTAAPLTVYANNQWMQVGTTVPTLTASYSGFVNGDTSSSLATQPTLSTTANSSSTVAGSPYPIVASGAVNPDYSFTYVAGSMTVTTLPVPTMTVSDGGTYNGSAYVASGLVNGGTSLEGMGLTYTYYVGTAPVGTPLSAAPISAGTYTVVASFAGSADYSATQSTPMVFAIGKAPLTVTANSLSKAYGAPLPTLAGTMVGLIAGDGITASYTTSATAASHVQGGGYPITPSLSDPNNKLSNYVVTIVNGTLTVSPVLLTVTALNQAKVYGAVLPTLTASYSGFVNGDSSPSLTTQPTLTTTATGASHVSGNPYTITASGAIDADYTISYVAGSLSVSPAPLTITANHQAKPYGLALPILTASYSGLVNGDTSASLTTQPTLTTTATASSTVSGGPYTITVGGAADPDYSINYAAGNLTVTPAVPAVTISSSSTSIAYGQSFTLTATLSATVPPNEGTVTFSANGVSLGSSSVTAGAATIGPFALSVANYQIVATYSDASGNYATAGSTAIGAWSINDVAGAGVYAGDGGPASAANLNDPHGVVVDASGNTFVADTANNVVREINHATGIITTVAGTGTPGYNGDNIAATAAELHNPGSLAVDSAGDLFIADASNSRVREVSATTGIITTVVGTGTSGYNGDNIPATAANLAGGAAIAFDSAGDLFIADANNDRIREVNKVTGLITTIAGNGGSGFSGDGGAPTNAELDNPEGVAVDSGRGRIHRRHLQ